MISLSQFFELLENLVFGLYENQAHIRKYPYLTTSI